MSSCGTGNPGENDHGHELLSAAASGRGRGTGHGIPRDKIFSEKISTRIRVRPKFEEALRTAREVKAHAPHCRVIFTVYEMKRLGRDAAELTALADHLTAHGLILEMIAGPLPGIYDPTGPGKLRVRHGLGSSHNGSLGRRPIPLLSENRL